MSERYVGESPFDQPDLSVGTISAERKALDLVIQASRADPKLRAAVLEVEKWIARLTDSVGAAYQAVDEIEADRDEAAASLAAMSKTVEQMTIQRDRSYRQGYDRGFRSGMSAIKDAVERETRLHESMEMECDG